MPDDPVGFLMELHIFVTKNFFMTAAGIASDSPHATRYCSAIVAQRNMFLGLALLYKLVENILVVRLGASCSTTSFRQLNICNRILLRFPIFDDY